MVAAADAAARAAALALAAIHRPHPYHLTHVVADDVAVTPRGLYPIFWGAFDWHSAVHGHWTLAAFARRWPAHPLAAAADYVIELHAGPERSVAATKTYTAQLTVMAMLVGLVLEGRVLFCG